MRRTGEHDDLTSTSAPTWPATATATAATDHDYASWGHVPMNLGQRDEHVAYGRTEMARWEGQYLQMKHFSRDHISWATAGSRGPTGKIFTRPAGQF